MIICLDDLSLYIKYGLKISFKHLVQLAMPLYNIVSTVVQLEECCKRPLHTQHWM